MKETINDIPVSEFLKYSVGIFGQVIIGDPPLATVFSFTGFLIDYRDRIWLVSAAHAIRRLRAARSANRLMTLALRDSWSDSSGRGRPVVLDMESLDRWVNIGTSDHDYDVAALQLDGLAVTALIQGEVKPFRLAGPIDRSPAADFYAVVGYPSEMVWSDAVTIPFESGQRIIRGAANVDMPRVIGVVSPSEPDAAFDQLDRDRFYATIVEVADAGVRLKDIDGMSGGPIVAIAKEQGKAVGRLVAMQSSWLKSRKQVAGEYLDSVLTMIDDSIDAVR